MGTVPVGATITTRHTAMNVVSVSQTGTIGCQPSSSLQSHSFASGRGELTQLEGEPEWTLKYARTYPVECSCPTHETQHKSPGAVSHANVTPGGGSVHRLSHRPPLEVAQELLVGHLLRPKAAGHFSLLLIVWMWSE